MRASVSGLLEGEGAEELEEIEETNLRPASKAEIRGGKIREFV